MINNYLKIRFYFSYLLAKYFFRFTNIRFDKRHRQAETFLYKVISTVDINIFSDLYRAKDTQGVKDRLEYMSKVF